MKNHIPTDEEIEERLKNHKGFWESLTEEEKKWWLEHGDDLLPIGPKNDNKEI